MPEIDVSYHDPRISIEYWWPRLAELDVPTPETELVPIEFTDEGPRWETDALVEAVDSFESDHAFLRSDRKAANVITEAAYVHSATPEAVDNTAMRALLQMSDMDIPPSSFAIREWLDLDTHAQCYARPVAPEVRVFVDEGDVLCHHLRPTRDDLDRSVDDPEAMLDDLREVVEADWETVRPYAERVAKEFDDSGWSVDFVRTEAGDWYCTDMALYGLYYYDMPRGESCWKSVSYHESGCPHNLEEPLPDDLPEEPENPRTKRMNGRTTSE